MHFPFRKAAKLGVVGGAVYFTVVNGVWGKDNKQVLTLVEQLRKDPDAEEAQQEQNRRLLGERYNEEVQKFFKVAARSPAVAKDLSQKAVSWTKDKFNEIQRKS